MSGYRIEIDHRTCSGTSNCAEESPEVFEVNERGLSVVRPGEHSLEAVLRGAQACPVDAIRVFDASGKQLHP